MFFFEPNCFEENEESELLSRFKLTSPADSPLAVVCCVTMMCPPQMWGHCGVSSVGTDRYHCAGGTPLQTSTKKYKQLYCVAHDVLPVQASSRYCTLTQSCRPCSSQAVAFKFSPLYKQVKGSTNYSTVLHTMFYLFKFR